MDPQKVFNLTKKKKIDFHLSANRNKYNKLNWNKENVEKRLKSHQSIYCLNDVPPDESPGETDCCGFSVYSIVVQMKKNIE